MTRRWEPREFELDGLRWRVVKGKKTSLVPGEDDLRLEHMTPQGWRPTAMALVFMLTDFWYENEDVLYPKPRFQGADYLLRAIKRAALNGFQSEVDRLEGEKVRKRQKEQGLLLQPALQGVPPRVETPAATGPVDCVTFSDCDGDPEWHCAICRIHLDSVYLLCAAHGEPA